MIREFKHALYWKEKHKARLNNCEVETQEIVKYINLIVAVKYRFSYEFSGLGR